MNALCITRVETFMVSPRWLFVRVETDDGVVGWGEATCEGRSETVRTAVDQLSELLVGADALRTEDHWQVMTKGSFYRGGPILASAVSGLDQALWDIKGKHFGAPVHQLLGARQRVGQRFLDERMQAALQHGQPHFDVRRRRDDDRHRLDPVQQRLE